MAQRPNRLPTSLRERTLNMESTRNKSSPAQQQNTTAVSFSDNSGATTSGGGGASCTANQTELKSDTDKLSNTSSNAPNGVSFDVTSGAGNQSNLFANSSRKSSPSPSPSPTPSPGLTVRSSNSSRTSSPKRALKESFPEESLAGELASSNTTTKNQNRLSGTGFIRVGSSPGNLSDSRESIPSSKSSGGSMDSKDEG